MDERLRMMFREEMSAERQPPLGDLLEDAVRDGRRARRTRRVWIGLGSTGVVAVLAAGAFVIVPGKSPQRDVAPLKGPVPVLAASSTSTVIKQPSGPKSPVTDAAVVEQLARLLPAGRTSGFAQGPKENNRYAFGQIYLDSGKGPGMVRAFVYKGGLSDKACSTSPDTKGYASKEKAELTASPDKKVQEQVRRRYAALMAQKRPGCKDLPGGGRALIEKNADGTGSATVDHGNGIVVLVFTSTWLAWDGTTNPPGTVALTPDQVLKIAAFPGWAGVLSGITARRTGAWAVSIAVGAAGPVLSAVLYRLTADQVYLWNESASALVLALAVSCLLIATATTAAFRRRVPREHDGETDPVHDAAG